MAAIEKSKDVDSLKINELVGPLQTFEMTLGSLKEKNQISLTKCPYILKLRAMKECQIESLQLLENSRII